MRGRPTFYLATSLLNGLIDRPISVGRPLTLARLDRHRDPWSWLYRHLGHSFSINQHLQLLQMTRSVLTNRPRPNKNNSKKNKHTQQKIKKRNNKKVFPCSYSSCGAVAVAVFYDPSSIGFSPSEWSAIHPRVVVFSSSPLLSLSLSLSNFLFPLLSVALSFVLKAHGVGQKPLTMEAFVQNEHVCQVLLSLSFHLFPH